MSKRILVGYDDSTSSQHALDHALELARESGGRVQVVYAAALPAGSPETAASLIADASALRPGLSEKVLLRATQAGVKVEWKVVPGSAGDVLLAELKSGAFDQLVIGGSGRGTLARWLLGSVTNDVVEKSPVPVTIVP